MFTTSCVHKEHVSQKATPNLSGKTRTARLATALFAIACLLLVSGVAFAAPSGEADPDPAEPIENLGLVLPNSLHETSLDPMTANDPCLYCGVRAHLGGGKWQCIEYVTRFWRKVFGYWDTTPSGNAYKIFKYAGQKKLRRYKNGRTYSRPQCRDILCFRPTTQWPAGHVAIVCKVQVNRSRIQIIEQNWSRTRCRAWLPIQCKNGKWYMPRRGTRPIEGWCRSRRKRVGSGRHGKPPPTYSPGDGAKSLSQVQKINAAYGCKVYGSHYRNGKYLGVATGRARKAVSGVSRLNGLFQKFQGGAISLRHWKNVPRAFAVYNKGGRKFYRAWRYCRKGGKGLWRGPLGHAKSDAKKISGGRWQQKFEGGYLLYHKPHARWVVSVRLYRSKSEASVASAVGPVVLSSVNTQQVNAQLANIVYTLSAPADVTIEVRNIAGRLISSIPCDRASSGINTATWNLRNSAGTLVPSGRFLCTIVARSQDGTQMRAMATMTIQR